MQKTGKLNQDQGAASCNAAVGYKDDCKEPAGAQVSAGSEAAEQVVHGREKEEPRKRNLEAAEKLLKVADLDAGLGSELNDPV